MTTEIRLKIINTLSQSKELNPDTLRAIDKILHDKRVVPDDEMFSTFAQSTDGRQIFDIYLCEKHEANGYDPHTGKSVTYIRWDSKIKAIKICRDFFHNQMIECYLSQAKDIIERMTTNK